MKTVPMKTDFQGGSAFDWALLWGACWKLSIQTNYVIDGYVVVVFWDFRPIQNLCGKKKENGRPKKNTFRGRSKAAVVI